MQDISNMDLQNLRHLIGSEQLAAEKARFFSQQVNDPQLRNFLEKKAHGAEQNAHTLMNFLNG